VGVVHVSPSYVHVMSNSMLLWWTSDSVTLPLVIKPKVVKEALQWRSERQAQVQSYVDETHVTRELKLQCNYFTLVERHFCSKDD